MTCLTSYEEQLVKTRHAAVNAAKHVLDEEHAKASASQKEVVGLLERKHSWSAADLERYMALIRSEHINDQAVQAAKDNIAIAERVLEETRTRLEKRERAQYHEEQIWSDTIRRNSTWVTFVLMGVNILLLLANVVVIEPWRRRRMVREIKATLEEKAVVAATAPLAVIAAPAVEEDIGAAVEPEGISLEHLETISEIISKVSSEVDAYLEDPVAPVSEAGAYTKLEGASFSSWEGLNIWLQSLFSTQLVSLQRVDVTTIAIEAAAAGAAITGLLVVLLRPR